MTMKKIFTNISKRDIAIGEPTHFGRCPLARSLKRKFPDHEIRVRPTNVQIKRPGGLSALAILSPKAQAWIKMFDGGCIPAEPARFQLTIMEGTVS